MCGIVTNRLEHRSGKCNVNHRLFDEEYVKYLEIYEFEDSEHNYKCFIIWKGFGMSMENEP